MARADKKASQYQQIDKVICFLKGLNENFGTLRSIMILMHPFPEIDRAFALALQHEQQIRTTETIGIHENDSSVNNFTATNRPLRGLSPGCT